MQSAIVVNFYEFRTGVWLPKAYFVGLDTGGRPQTVHQTAKPDTLARYGIAETPQLLRILSLTEGLRDKAIAEHFRRGSKKVPTLAGLLKENSKERGAVLRYVHARTAEVLVLCRTEDRFVTLNMDTRGVVQPALLRFTDELLEPHLHFCLDSAGMHYRLRLQNGPGEQLVRHLDPRILTNRPAPGWVVIERTLFQVRDMRGDGLRPFLTRDEVLIPPADVPRYLRKFVARAVRLHDPVVEGFTFARVEQPTGLRLAARPHPFTEHYFIHVYLRYGVQEFALGEQEQIAVTHTLQPPYQLTRIRRDPSAEERLLEPLYRLGLQAATDTAGAMTLSAQPGHFENLRWLLDHTEQLAARGILIDPPEEEGRHFIRQEASLEVSATEAGDWLDLSGTVCVGEHSLPFVRVVKQLQRGERRYLLPSGEYVLLPEEWFTRYGPGLALARTEGRQVRMARSQAGLLVSMDLTVPVEQTVAPPEYTPSASLQATLRPYQLEGARWLVRHYHGRLGACLADDMGLGKTLQTIAVLLYAKEQLGQQVQVPGGWQGDLFSGPAPDEAYLQPLRALIVLPASLVYNWLTELQKFAPCLTVLANVGTKRQRDARVLRRYDVLLTTYQTALRDQELLTKLELTYIVLDESQQIKNRQSKVFRALNSIPAPHRISLSGTPIENSLSDLWSQMQFINPGLLRGFSFFKKAFITPIEVHDDELKKEQLRQLVGPHLLRRTKAEVAPDLPELDVQVYFCEMTSAQRRRYEAERSAARNALLGTSSAEEQQQEGSNKLRVIQTLTRLRQLANHPAIADPGYTKDSGKFSEAVAQWDTLRRAGHKVLVFSSMVKHLKLFRQHLEREQQPYAWLTGSVDTARRAEEVRRFQEDPAVQTFLISIKAGGTGLNLTAADYVFILDPWWNPTVEDQAIARAHRIGRTGHVFARKFLSKDTLEEKIHRLQQRKKRLAGEIIDGRDMPDLDAGEIEYLLT